MYKKKILITILAFTIQSAGILASCGNNNNSSSSTSTMIQLLTPAELDVSDYILSWTMINGANKYLLDINGTENEVITNSFSLFDLTLDERYDFKVKAIGDDTRIDSDWSTLFTYTITTSKLPSPVLSASNGILTWNLIPHVRAYTFGMFSETGESFETEFPLEAHSGFELIEADIGCTVKVKALSGHQFYTDSDYSELLILETYL